MCARHTQLSQALITSEVSHPTSADSRRMYNDRSEKIQALNAGVRTYKSTSVLRTPTAITVECLRTVWGGLSVLLRLWRLL